MFGNILTLVFATLNSRPVVTFEESNSPLHLMPSLRSHHVNLVDIKCGPGQMAHKLDEHNRVEQRPHRPGVISAKQTLVRQVRMIS